MEQHRMDRSHDRTAGFTLVELLITVSVIGIMASMVLFAMFRATESARVKKTEAIIASLDAIIRVRWESYSTRRVPIDVPPNSPPNVAGKLRLDAQRELMRMELPERWSDIAVINGAASPPADVVPSAPISLPAPPSVWNQYLRRVQAIHESGLAQSPPQNDWPTQQFQAAECLYLIVMAAMSEEGDSPDIFKADSIGDKDGDGALEFWDAWGTPIAFLRWAPAFTSERQTIATFQAYAGENIPAVDSGAAPFESLLRSTRAPAIGSFVGGAIVQLDTDSGLFVTTSSAQITGYNYVPAANGEPAYGEFKCIGRNFTIGQGSTFCVLGPDPLDPRRIYPNPSTPHITFAVYPLIYSAGPDKQYDVRSTVPEPAADIVFGTPTHNNNPFVGYGLTPDKTLQFGLQGDFEPKNNVDEWKDNLHNHRVAVR